MIFKTSWKRLEDIFARRLADPFKTFLQDVMKTSWRSPKDTFARRLENVLKTSWGRMAKTNILLLIKTSWRRLENVMWRRRRKTSSRYLQDVFIKANVCSDVSKILDNYKASQYVFCKNVVLKIFGKLRVMLLFSKFLVNSE